TSRLATCVMLHLLGFTGSSAGVSQCSHWFPATGTSAAVVMAELTLMPVGALAAGFAFSVKALWPEASPPRPRSTSGDRQPGSAQAASATPPPFTAAGPLPGSQSWSAHSTSTRHPSISVEHNPGA